MSVVRVWRGYLGRADDQVKVRVFVSNSEKLSLFWTVIPLVSRAERRLEPRSLWAC
jgi:hypothetical protein